MACLPSDNVTWPDLSLFLGLPNNPKRGRFFPTHYSILTYPIYSRRLYLSIYIYSLRRLSLIPGGSLYRNPGNGSYSSFLYGGFFSYGGYFCFFQGRRQQRWAILVSWRWFDYTVLRFEWWLWNEMCGVVSIVVRFGFSLIPLFRSGGSCSRLFMWSFLLYCLLAWWRGMAGWLDGWDGMVGGWRWFDERAGVVE